MTALVVATANVLRSLRPTEARAALDAVLEAEPDLVALQEWGPTRYPLLGSTGCVRVVPSALVPWRPSGRPARDYQWYSSLVGGCAVGARAARFRLRRWGTFLLDRPGRAERPDRPFGIEPPRFAALATYDDLATGRGVALVSYHLVSGVQVRGGYRDDWPRLVRRHRGEVERLQRQVDRLVDAGYDVHAAGDSNFDGLRLSGLVSAWEGRDRPGTLGRRSVDDVFGPGAAAAVTLLTTASDHRAVVVRSGG